MKDTCVAICQQLRWTDSVRPSGNPEWKLSSDVVTNSTSTSNAVVIRNRVLNAESISVEYSDMELYLQYDWNWTASNLSFNCRAEG
jgi:hypothetical protein